MNFDRKNLTDDQLKNLYRALVKPRIIEEKMLKLLRQGKVSKWFSGIGQEAISVGIGMALESDEYIMPLHRNLGIFTTRKMPLAKLFMQWQGKKEGFSKGRERSFHFGSNEHHIVGMISHLGPQLCLANGISLAYKLKKEKKVSVTFTGDGGTSQGDFHEALNIAAVWELPTIFIIENNGYGLSTPVNEQYRCEQLASRGAGYGMKSLTIDGNNILEVYHTISELAQQMREKPFPVLIECMTFRMRGHEEASGTKYVPQELFDIWGKKDPVSNYENYLKEIGLIDEGFIFKVKFNIQEEIDRALDITFAAPEITADTAEECADIYAPDIPENIELPLDTPKTEKRLVDGISDGLRQSMERHPNLVIMGQDVAEYGGVFKITEGFVEQFGKDRVRNTPLCESGILSAGLGMSIKGMKSVIEMQFADFVSTGFNAIVNNLAKSYYRWGQNADVVVRMPTGAGVGAGPFHSQSNEAWFTKVPGLKVVYPSSVYDAKGLLAAAINDPNPVMFFEHKALYRSIQEEIPDAYYTIEIGKAKVARAGEELTVITYGAGVHWAMDTVKELNIDADIIDLRTLLPLDWETIKASVAKTGKVIILHEDTLTSGIGGEISAYISEHLFDKLDAPIVRIASLDTPVPFAIPLENNFLPKERFKVAIEKLLNY
jgi:2-oxoisovalerate dehydrogenase E1 component